MRQILISNACERTNESRFNKKCNVFWIIMTNLMMINTHHDKSSDSEDEILISLHENSLLCNTDLNNILTLIWIHYTERSYRRTNIQLARKYSGSPAVYPLCEHLFSISRHFVNSEVTVFLESTSVNKLVAQTVGWINNLIVRKSIIFHLSYPF